MGLTNRKFLSLLILLDLFMAISAIYVDFRDFFVVPWYLVLFVPICPLYPLLLAINFSMFLKKGKFSQGLLHFTMIGIMGYGIMAYIFYPAYLITKGFTWYEFGNMFWVTLYAAQALLLLPVLKKINILWYAPMMGYFMLKDFLDRFGDTFSYHREAVFSSNIENFLFGAVLTLHLIGMLFLIFKTKTREICAHAQTEAIK